MWSWSQLRKGGRGSDWPNPHSSEKSHRRYSNLTLQEVACLQRSNGTSVVMLIFSVLTTSALTEWEMLAHFIVYTGSR
jgi:hypothetical protein